MANKQIVNKKYRPTIGIECHVQLKTKTKLFAPVGNDARDAAPNTLISHICVGMPGALPVLNQGAVELAVRAAFALGTEPQNESYFERKHYFYPDSPAGYQISQLHNPIIVGGEVTIEVDGSKKNIRINRAQLEADAGKNTHPEGANYSLVDLNRAGTPLLEIVSEPDIHSAAEAKAYARELYLLMKYADVSDVDLYHGNMRFDVNVSVSNTDKLGVRAEVKNLNSFRSVENAVLYEIDRQIALLEKGETIMQETRGWDDVAQKTTTQRNKEEAHDYRYMPDPDIPPIVLKDEDIKRAKSQMPMQPQQYRDKLRDIGIDKSTIEDIIAIPQTAQTVLRILQASNDETARRVAFWEMQQRLDIDTDAGLTTTRVADEQYIKLSNLVTEGKLSSSAAKQVLGELQNNGGDALEHATKLNLIQESSEEAITEIVSKILAENPKAAEDVKNGEMKAIGFLVGQVMKASGGKANPAITQEIIKKQLGI